MVPGEIISRGGSIHCKLFPEDAVLVEFCFPERLFPVEMVSKLLQVELFPREAVFIENCFHVCKAVSGGDGFPGKLFPLKMVSK
jgi:hypothetical protein